MYRKCLFACDYLYGFVSCCIVVVISISVTVITFSSSRQNAKVRKSSLSAETMAREKRGNDHFLSAARSARPF